MLLELSVVEQRYHAVMEVLGGVSVTDVAERYLTRFRVRCSRRAWTGSGPSRTPPGRLTAPAASPR